MSAITSIMATVDWGWIFWRAFLPVLGLTILQWIVLVLHWTNHQDARLSQFIPFRETFNPFGLLYYTVTMALYSFFAIEVSNPSPKPWMYLLSIILTTGCIMYIAIIVLLRFQFDNANGTGKFIPSGPPTGKVLFATFSLAIGAAVVGYFTNQCCR